MISPTRRIDLALPGATTLGEILPNIIRFSGYEGGAANEVVHTWVLQRFGEDPLDPAKRISALDIRDGETLHLRQREATMPDAAFDDVVDAVASATNTRPSWTPLHSMRMSLGVLVLFTWIIPFLLLRSGAGLVASLATVGVAAALGLAAALLSRAFNQRTVSAVLAWLCVSLGGLGGFYLFTNSLTVRLLAASALVLLASGVMALAVQVHPFHFLSAAVAALFIVLATMAAVLIPDRPVEIAAITMVVMLALTPMLPGLCYRFARVAMPNLPTSAEQLSADDQPVQSDIVVRAIAADRILASLIVAGTVVASLSSVVVIRDDHWAAKALCAVVALALLLRARAFVGLTQRLALLLSGTFITVLTLSAIGMGMESAGTRLALGLVIVVLLAVLMANYAANFADRILSPYWGRFGDVFEWLSIMAIVPLLLAMLHVYTYVLGMVSG